VIHKLFDGVVVDAALEMILAAARHDREPTGKEVMKQALSLRVPPCEPGDLIALVEPQTSIGGPRRWVAAPPTVATAILTER
jgi:hypothetical protein